MPPPSHVGEVKSTAGAVHFHQANQSKQLEELFLLMVELAGWRGAGWSDAQLEALWILSRVLLGWWCRVNLWSGSSAVLLRDAQAMQCELYSLRMMKDDIR